MWLFVLPVSAHVTWSASSTPVRTRSPRTSYVFTSQTLELASEIWRRHRHLLTFIPPFDLIHHFPAHSPQDRCLSSQNLLHILHSFLSHTIPALHPLRLLLLSRYRLTLTSLAILHLVSVHRRLSSRPDATVRFRMALLNDVQCPRLHIDKVDLRGICTLVGKGTVVEGETGEDGYREGVVVFLPGAGFEEEHRERAVKHRSPLTCRGERRLILQTDIFEKG